MNQIKETEGSLMSLSFSTVKYRPRVETQGSTVTITEIDYDKYYPNTQKVLGKYKIDIDDLVSLFFKQSDEFIESKRVGKGGRKKKKNGTKDTLKVSKDIHDSFFNRSENDLINVSRLHVDMLKNNTDKLSDNEKNNRIKELVDSLYNKLKNI